MSCKNSCSIYGHSYNTYDLSCGDSHYKIIMQCFHTAIRTATRKTNSCTILTQHGVLPLTQNKSCGALTHQLMLRLTGQVMQHNSHNTACCLPHKINHVRTHTASCRRSQSKPCNTLYRKSHSKSHGKSCNKSCSRPLPHRTDKRPAEKPQT